MTEKHEPLRGKGIPVSEHTEPIMYTKDIKSASEGLKLEIGRKLTLSGDDEQQIRDIIDKWFGVDD